MSTKMSGQGYLCTAACNLLLALPQCLYTSIQKNLTVSRLVRISEGVASQADLLLALAVIVNARGFAEYDPFEKANSVSRKGKIRMVYPVLNVLASAVLAVILWVCAGGSTPLTRIAVMQTCICLLLALSAKHL